MWPVKILSSIQNFNFYFSDVAKDNEIGFLVINKQLEYMALHDILYIYMMCHVI